MDKLEVEGLELNLEGNIVRDDWMDSGFAEDFNRVTEDMDVTAELVHNLIHIGTASTLQNKYEELEEESEINVETFNVIGIGVFAHLLDEVGDEAFDAWTENAGYDRNYMFGDVDMYFPAGRPIKDYSRPSIDTFYEQEIGSDIEEPLNGDHLGEKYTANLDFSENMEVEIDLIRPEVNSDSDYPMAQDDPVRVETEGGAELATPPLEECIYHKGTLEKDNGNGHDTMRDKDYRELATLLHIAEERDISPEYFEDNFDQEALKMIGTRADGIADVADEWDYQPSDEYVSRIDQWQHMYS